MTELCVCFVGVGSIARRHIRNLSNICQNKNIKLTIDAVRRIGHNNDVPQINKIYEKIEDIECVYDIVFITNPTEFHLDTLQKSSCIGRHFFIEKPVCSVNQLDRLEAVGLNENAMYYVACPLRYNAVIQYIKNNVNLDDVVSIRCISSSYLPDWRPGIDYRTTYSAQKVLGGGVSIDLIHEWDYITYLFGVPQKIQSIIGKKSKLEIDSEDFAIYIAEYENMIAELHLDYFGRKTIREITLFTNEETIIGDIANNRIMFLNSDRVISFAEQRDDYQIRELLHFLEMIEGTAPRDSGISHAKKVLRLTQGTI